MIIELTPGKYFLEGKYCSKRFCCEMTVRVDLNDSVSEETVAHCVTAVESFSDGMMQEICEAAKRYALAFIELCRENMGADFSFADADLPEITAKTPAREMLKYFSVSELLVDQPEENCQQYFRLSGECDWEIEHGFEAAFQDGKLVYLGSFDDVTPSRLDYYVNDKGREWNYAVKGE